MLISSDYFLRLCDTQILKTDQMYTETESMKEEKRFYIKSSQAEDILGPLILKDQRRFDGVEIILHGDDKTISTKTAQSLVSRGLKISSVNWIGSQDLVRSLPIGIATVDRLPSVSKRDFARYQKSLYFSALDGERDITLYVNFDITTNISIRKSALLSSLKIESAFVPTAPVGLLENLSILSRSRFVLSPPGAGPDCFRTWEAIYLGAVPIVLKSHWPFAHLDLPVITVESYENIESVITNYSQNLSFSRSTMNKYFLYS